MWPHNPFTCHERKWANQFWSGTHLYLQVEVAHLSHIGVNPEDPKAVQQFFSSVIDHVVAYCEDVIARHNEATQARIDYGMFA